MDGPISLKNLERSLYRQTNQDGILEIQIGGFLLIFAIAPPLSRYLGDFWSSAVFLPIWAGMLLGLRYLRKQIIEPRLGSFRPGEYRQKRLTRLSLVMLVFNLAALGLGFLSFSQFGQLPDWIHSARFSALLLIGFSLGAYLLELPRLYLYGILVAAGPFVGEYLYQSFGFAHHGLPITFGILSGGLILTGVIILGGILVKYPSPTTTGAE